MKRLLAICGSCLLAAVSVSAQGRGHMRPSAPMRSPNTSNAPAGTPHASTDRDFGRDRAADVGRGKHTGLEKDSDVQNTGKPVKTKKAKHAKKANHGKSADARADSGNERSK